MHLFGQPPGINSAHQGQAAYSPRASTLPMLGTLLAQKCIVFGLKGTGLLPKRYWFTN